MVIIVVRKCLVQLIIIVVYLDQFVDVLVKKNLNHSFLILARIYLGKFVIVLVRGYLGQFVIVLVRSYLGHFIAINSLPL